MKRSSGASAGFWVTGLMVAMSGAMEHLKASPSYQTDFKNELIPFTEKLDGIFETLENSLELSLKESPRSTSLDIYLKAVLNALSRTSNGKEAFTLKALGIDSKVIQVIGESTHRDPEVVNLFDLMSVIKKSPTRFSTDEKAMLLGTVLLHINGGASKKAAPEIIFDLLDSQSLIDGDRVLDMSSESLEKVGIKPDEKTFTPKTLQLALRQNDSILGSAPMAKTLLTDIIKNMALDPELLDLSLRPIKQQFYRAALKEVNKFGIHPPSTFEAAQDLVEHLRARRAIEFENRLANPEFSKPFSGVTPIEEIEKHQCPQRGIVIPPAIENTQNEKRGRRRSNQNSQNSNENRRGQRTRGDFQTPEAEIIAPEKLQACLNVIKKKRYNVELTLPGSLCASTPVSSDPDEELRQMNQKSESEFCDINLITAVHCVNSVQLRGRRIDVKIGGQHEAAIVNFVGRIDPAGGPPVRDGNPDMALMQVRTPCGVAKKLNFARVPTRTQIEKLSEEVVPLVLQQNSDINASANGNNRATIAATGRFQFSRSPNSAKRKMGNFIHFNTNVGLNQSVRGLDSSFVQSGDSGGAALTCSEKDSQLDVLYLGAISFVIERDGQREGRLGGIASGRSLLGLSRLLGNQTDQFATRDSETLEEIGQHANALQ